MPIEEPKFGSSICICPKCGREISHARRGVPCAKVKCPVCGTPMMGKRCAGVKDD